MTPDERKRKRDEIFAAADQIEQGARQRLKHELDEAERKAWEALARYKFQMFGYWAAVWVHVNRIGEFKRPNPWRSLVHSARNQFSVTP